MKCKCEEYRKMLYAVVDELDLADSALVGHGPAGTSPAELVRLVLTEKDRKIQLLKNSFTEINTQK